MLGLPCQGLDDRLNYPTPNGPICPQVRRDGRLTFGDQPPSCATSSLVVVPTRNVLYRQVQITLDPKALETFPAVLGDRRAFCATVCCLLFVWASPRWQPPPATMPFLTPPDSCAGLCVSTAHSSLLVVFPAISCANISGSECDSSFSSLDLDSPIGPSARLAPPHPLLAERQGPQEPPPMPFPRLLQSNCFFMVH